MVECPFLILCKDLDVLIASPASKPAVPEGSELLGPRQLQVTPFFSSLRGPQILLHFAFHSDPRARVSQSQPRPLSYRSLGNRVASSHTVPSLSFSLQVVALESAIPLQECMEFLCVNTTLFPWELAESWPA